MTEQLIKMIFRTKTDQTPEGWNLIKHMALTFDSRKTYILPDWAEILFIVVNKQEVNEKDCFIKITNPSRRDIEYAKTLMDFGDKGFIKSQLKPNMRVV